MDDLLTPSNFNFSAVSLDQLGASEYTLATILVDTSWSVADFAQQLEDCLKTILTSCQDSPRSENLMIRVCQFNNSITEVHGFKLLNSIKDSDYDGKLQCAGMTSCFDAMANAIESANEYAKILKEQDFCANGVVYVITDGMDNTSHLTVSEIKSRLDKLKKDENLESMDVILIGVGEEDLTDYLSNLNKDLDLEQYISLSELFKKQSPEKALAKLAGWISKSVSLTSQSLATGQSNSLPLSF